MPVGNTYRFNSRETDYSTCFLVEGDKVAFLADPVIPPAGTNVSLPDGREAVVLNSRLDLSNRSSFAMVYVSLEIAGREPQTAVPIKVR